MCVVTLNAAADELTIVLVFVCQMHSRQKWSATCGTR